MTSVPCKDCGTSDMPLDAVLTGAQWAMVCPEGSVLCAACIVRRAARLPGVINLTARITFAADFGNDTPGGRYFEYLKQMDRGTP